MRFYRHLIAKLALLGYAVSFEGRGAGRRLVAVPVIESQRA
jgi:hypothetical protein